MEKTADATEDGIGFLYENARRSIAGSDAFSFWVDNTSGDVLNMNFSISDGKKISYTLPDGAYVIAEDGSGENGQILDVLYGRFCIPAGFSGNLYIPLEQMQSEDGAVRKFTNIVSWGLTIVMPKTEEAEASTEEEEQQMNSIFQPEQEKEVITESRTFSLKQFGFWKNSVEVQNSRYCRYEVTGQSKVQIPTVENSVSSLSGQVTDLYQNKKDLPVKFSLEQEVAGVSITEDGILTVMPAAQPGTFVVDVQAEGASNKAAIEITLYESWRVNYEGQGGKIPEAGQEASLMTETMSRLGASVWFVRIIVIGSVFVMFALYKYYKKLSKKQHKVIHQLVAEKQEEK